MWAEDFMKDPASFSGWLADADRYLIREAGLCFLSNSKAPNPANKAAEVWEYAPTQLRASYSGAPRNVFQLARTHSTGGGDRGHSFSFFPNGDYLLATTERVGDPPGNPTESFYVVRAGLSGEITAPAVRRILAETLFTTSPPVGAQGARFTAQFPDGTVLLGCGNFVRIPAEVLLDPNSDLTVYRATRWWADGGHGELIDSSAFDCVVDPRFPDHVWFEGSDRTWRLNLSGASGLRRADRMFQGSNVGDPTDGGWPGGIDFGPDNFLWKCQSFRSKAVAFSPEQQDAAPGAAGQANGNPTPARDLESPVFETIDPNVEGLHRVVFDALGGAEFSTLRWADTQFSRAWHFSAAAMAAGGPQMPDREITNLMHAPISMRYAPGFGLRLR